jgi:hypothetical protein
LNPFTPVPNYRIFAYFENSQIREPYINYSWQTKNTVSIERSNKEVLPIWLREHGKWREIANKKGKRTASLN